MMEVINLGNIALLHQAQAILDFEPSKDLFTEATKPITVGKNIIVPWGENNDMPNIVLSNIEKDEIVSSNLMFNSSVAYGLGLKPMIKQLDGTLIDCVDQNVLDFFETNDINAWFFEQMNDIVTFYQPFNEIILDKAGRNIVQLRSKEALFSRWGVMDAKSGNITKHYYSAKWADGAKEADITATTALDRYNLLFSLQELSVKEKRFIVPVNMPTPGRPYYPRPNWWSMFNSGWFDYSLLIPSLKTALLQNKLAIKYIIYISDKYWIELFKSKKVDINDAEACEIIKEEQKTKFTDFLKNQSNKGGGMLALKKMISSGNSVIEEKYIEIVELKNDNKGGEMLDDSQEATAVKCYAMGVHPSLIGAVPGKNGGSLSGTDKRELIMIKQMLMTPFRQRPLNVLNLIKKFNRWNKDLTFVIQDYNFTTLDNNKTGKEIKNNE